MPSIQPIKASELVSNEAQFAAAKLATVLITGAIVCVVGIARYWRRQRQQQYGEYKKEDIRGEDLTNIEGSTEHTPPPYPSSLRLNDDLDYFVESSPKSRDNGADDNRKADNCGTTISEPEGNNQVSEEPSHKKRLRFLVAPPTFDNISALAGAKTTDDPDDDNKSDSSFASSGRSVRPYARNSRLTDSKITF